MNEDKKIIVSDYDETFYIDDEDYGRFSGRIEKK